MATRTIISALLKAYPFIEPFLFESHDSDDIRDQTAEIHEKLQALSERDRLLVRVALDLVNGSGNVAFNELLDDALRSDLRVILMAVC